MSLAVSESEMRLVELVGQSRLTDLFFVDIGTVRVESRDEIPIRQILVTPRESPGGFVHVQTPANLPWLLTAE